MGAVGQLHIGGSLLDRLVEQRVDFVQQGAAGRLGDAHAQRAGHVHGAGVDHAADAHLDRQRLAGDEALIDLRTAVLDDAIDGDALARAHQHKITRRDRGDRRLHRFALVAEAHRLFRLHRGQIGRDVAGAPTHAIFEIAPRQQEGEQHHAALEIGIRLVPDRLHDGKREREQDAEGDRHVHVGGELLQCADRALEERPAGIGDSRQGDERRKPVEEIAGRALVLARGTRPERDREQHDVHRGEGGDAEAAQQPPLLGQSHRVGYRRGEGIGGIAKRLEPRHDRLGRELALLPFHRHAAAGEIDARAAHGGFRREALLDGHDTGAAMDALDHQIHRAEPFGGASHEDREVLRGAHRYS